MVPLIPLTQLKAAPGSAEIGQASALTDVEADSSQLVFTSNFVATSSFTLLLYQPCKNASNILEL